jgi:hypothetical protein
MSIYQHKIYLEKIAIMLMSIKINQQMDTICYFKNLSFEL